ncbi:hypothetical protein [Actinoplanes awajinensis]|uniref:DUF1963 domain-containing protein n=1 Tax=Actinoplanes awajinensis subsp. mycoplanecinus TaxID=135947 RepID=A0A101JEL2_9ACTN|nr:hypothetical protein [Actinoplanes awajinensis]KUL25400.1 hypothetical protein ADL15_40720 [Actinoplanes awajinensis subsp. mycoplanecinus]
MIQELISRAAGDDDDAIEELIRIADAEPALLTPHLGALLDADVLWPATLYRTAGPDVVTRLVEMVDSGQRTSDLNRLFLIVAHSEDPLAEAAMRRWETQPPSGTDKLHVKPLIYALQSGWTLNPDGSRRDLCGTAAYTWTLRETPPRPDQPTCPWCTSPLWTAADLDTTEPAVAAALAHTGWTGRLMFRSCCFCACYATIFSQVTPDGASTWWPGNTVPDYLPQSSGPEDPPTRQAVTGAIRSTAHQASAWNEGGSTLGGHPQWIQDAEHPVCPGCAQPMDYVGLIGGADLDEYGEGAYYLHVHQPCGFTAVNYQQS